MTATTTSRPMKVRMRPPLVEFELAPPACCWTWSSGRLTGCFSESEAASAASTCHMKVVAATPPARRNRFMEDERPALEEGGGSLILVSAFGPGALAGAHGPQR